MTQKTYKYLLLIFLLVLFVKTMKAQENSKAGSAPIAEIYSVGTPSNSNNGAVNLSIPLFEISEGTLSVPISLYYSTNGIRVDDENSILGTGWQLSAGGAVTVEIRGICDNFETNGITTQNLTEKVYGANCGNLDGLNDIYHYNAPGISGKYVLDSQGNVIKLSDNNDLIYHTSDLIRITSPSGNIYYFDVLESTLDRDSQQYSSLTLLLSKICSPDLLSEINFEYMDEYYELRERRNLPVHFRCEQGNTSTSMGYSVPYKTQMLLQNVITKHGKVSFRYKSAPILHTNVNNQPEQVIDNIVLSKKNADNSYTPVRQVEFSYNYAKNRIFLAKIMERNPVTGKILPPYRFEYTNLEKIPALTNECLARDFWGYNNNCGLGFLSLGISSGRLPAYEYCVAGMLKKITYPTKATTEYQYELNTYNMTGTDWDDANWRILLYENGFVPLGTPLTNLPGPGVRLKKVISTNTDGIAKITEYGYSENGTSTGRLSVYPVFGFDKTVHGFNYFFESKISIAQGNSYVNYEKIFVLVDGWQNGMITYNYSAFPAIKTGTAGSNGYFYDVKIPQDDKNGLLLSKTVFAPGAIPLSEEIYNYGNLETLQPAANILGFVSHLLLCKNCDATYIYHHTINTPKYKIRLNSYTSKIYDDRTANKIAKTTITNYVYKDYTYNNRSYSYVKYTENITGGKTFINTVYRPLDYMGFGCTDSLKNLHILDVPIEQQTWEKLSATSFNLLSGNHTSYSTKIYDGTKRTLPETIYNLEQNNPKHSTAPGFMSNISYPNYPTCMIPQLSALYKPKQKFTYDSKGNVIQEDIVGKTSNAFIYDQRNVVIANTKNAKWNEVYYNGFENKENNNYIETPHTGKYAYKNSGQYSIGFEYLWNTDEHSGKYVATVWTKGNAGALFIEVRKGSNFDVFAKNVNSPIQVSNDWTYSECEIDFDQIKLDNPNETFFHIRSFISGQNIILDDHRFHPANAYMTTNTYEPFVGVTSVTDANNISQYTEYDDFGQAVVVRDNDKNIRAKNSYNYGVGILDELDFEITGNLNPDIRCNTFLSVEPNINQPDITWEWFYNSCQGNYDTTGQTFYTAPLLGNSRFCVHAKYNNEVSDCKCVDVNIKSVSFSTNADYLYFNKYGTPSQSITVYAPECDYLEILRPDFWIIARLENSNPKSKIGQSIKVECKPYGIKGPEQPRYGTFRIRNTATDQYITISVTQYN